MIGDKSDLDDLVSAAEVALQAGEVPELIGIYERMAMLGAAGATARVGELYEAGYVHGLVKFERNLDKAVNWYRKSICADDDPLAHLGLGRIYYSGCGTLQSDMAQAQIHLRIAYDHNLPQAGIYLGTMSLFGVGLEKNLPDAENFFLAAAVGGFPLGYRYLANIAASSGRFIRTIEMLAKECIFTLKLKIIDRHHPNLWIMPT
jgi:TPR repeat protein